MILRKYVINQKKFKIFLLLINFILIILTVIFLKFDKPIAEQVTVNSKVVHHHEIIQFQQDIDIKNSKEINNSNNNNNDNNDNNLQQQNDNDDEKEYQEKHHENLKKKKNQQNQHNKIPLIPEKYNDYNVKQRLIKDKIKYLTQGNRNNNNNDDDNNNNNNRIIELKKNSQHIHIFYNLPVSWYKEDINGQKLLSNELLKDTNEIENSITNITNNNNNNNVILSKRNINKSILDTAYYPLRGPYKQDNRILREHLNTIHNSGIGVLVVELNSSNTLRIKLLDKLFKLVPKYNISITFEINVNRNRTIEYLNDIINTLKIYFNKNGIYKVYSIKKEKYIPLIYVVDAYKIQIPDNKPTSCIKKLINLDELYDDIILIAHIRLKEHTDIVKRLCFDGFYSKMPSNGAFYASTWKNWGHLSRYAKSNQMIFIPTVGPGYSQKKIPRHGGFEKDRSNGKYYGFAWNTAITQNPQFISIASYNNWREGTQIEEAGVKGGYMNYLPGKPTKYLHLTAHWVNNYMKAKEKNQQTYNRCYNLFNNTIC